MAGYVKLEKDGEWIPAIIQPSFFCGYDAKIGNMVVCGISEDAVKFAENETFTQ